MSHPIRQIPLWPVVAVVGDTAVFLIFAALGRSAHRETSGPLHVLGVAAPFLAGWFVVAVLVGAYRAEAFRSVRAALRRTVTASIPGGLVALTIRSVLEGRVVPFSFVLVALSFCLGALSIWRAALVSLRHLVER